LLKCSNMICENFFHRDRAYRDMEDLALEYGRFKNSYRPEPAQDQHYVSIYPRKKKRRKKRRNETMESFWN